jgi:DUF438 domain-containing protein
VSTASSSKSSHASREWSTEPSRPEIPPGHAVDTFRRENEAVAKAAGTMRAAIAEIRQRPEGEEFDAALYRWQQAYNELTDVDKHYQRKENVLFPRLEEHGITGLSKVMWAKDDTARQLLKLVGRGLATRRLAENKPFREDCIP